MPEIINSLFGRTRNTTDGTGEVVDPTVTVTVEPTGDTTAPDYVTEDVDTTEDVASEQIPADSDVEEAAEAAADDEPATDEDTAEDDTVEEAATEVTDEDGDSAEDVEPAAETTEDADDVDADDTDNDTDNDADDVDDTDDADDVDEAEPVVVPVVAEARPAAGERGSVTVGEGVVGKVVNIVVGKIDGVHSLDDDGTSVEVADDVATIKVSFVVEYGHAIKALAEQIRIDVIEAVEQFLGLDVAAVDVHVSDIHAA